MKIPAAMFALSVALAGCGEGPSDEPVTMSVIAPAITIVNPQKARLHAGSRLMLDATAQGLVAFDATGRIEPALAQRWIIIEEGKSFIFRIRDATWSDGKPVLATEVAASLKRSMARNSGNPLSRLFGSVTSVVAMTGQVIEIRLARVEPNLLQLLAQPEMAIQKDMRGSGPFFIHSRRDGLTRLRQIADPMVTDQAVIDSPASGDVRLRAEGAARAIARFSERDAQLVTGGDFSQVPLVRASRQPAALFQVDPAYGLFGLQVVDSRGPLQSQNLRTAIALAIDRDALVGRFGLNSWQPAVSILPTRLDSAGPPAALGLMLRPRAERLMAARRLVNGSEASISIRVAMPEGPGSRLAFAALANDWSEIGIKAVRVGLAQPADVRLIDEVAAYSGALWYLDRLSCRAANPCSIEASATLDEAMSATDPAERARLISETDAIMTSAMWYIPVALPLRWSLVEPSLNGWRGNAFAAHPLRRLRNRE